MSSPVGQRTDILSAINTTQLDANGNGTCTVRPDVGQYWAPMVVRVSTNIKLTPVPACTIYHGPTAANAIATAYIDDTALGSQDTSSIIAGVSVQYGEAITAVWTGGTPGDVAILIVNGVTLTTPPSVGQIPQVPGTHFAGKLSTEITRTLARVPSISPTLVPANSSIFIPGPTLVTVFDMRQFDSFYFVMTAITSGASTGFDTLLISLIWYLNSTATNPVFNDNTEIFADGNGAFTFSGGTYTIQDQIHGPFLGIQVTNPFTSPDGVNIAYNIAGTTRQLTQPSYRQGTVPDGFVVKSIGTAIGTTGTTHVPCLYAHGRVRFIYTNGGAANMTFAVHWGGIGSIVASENTTVAAGAIGIFETIIPKRAAYVDVVGTVGQTFTLIGITLYDKES